jgi:nitroreductase
MSMAESKLAPDAMTVLHSRKSVRNFTGDKVTRDDLLKIVKAGMAAPSAVNMQPWSFVIVTDRSTMDFLASELPYAKMLDKAGAAIIVCALSTKAFQNKMEYAILDAACASENILLAAEALGLGAVWTAVYPEPEREELVRKVIGIPENVVPFSVIPVGHPTGVDKPQDKFRPENIHWGKW